MIPNNAITDQERGAFLRTLDGSDLMVSDWEAKFIASFLGCYRDWQFWTEGRRVSADKMRMKYGGEPEIKMPFPLAETSRPATPEADKDCCMFLKRDDDRRLRPCNDPGTKIGRNGFIYCDACGEAAQKAIRQRGGSMELRTYFPKK